VVYEVYEDLERFPFVRTLRPPARLTLNFFICEIKRLDSRVPTLHPRNYAFVESLAKPRDAAESHIPAVNSSRINRLGGGGFSAGTCNQLVDSSAVEVRAVNERVAGLISCKDRPIEALVTCHTSMLRTANWANLYPPM
jgi:hypothetical protein